MSIYLQLKKKGGTTGFANAEDVQSLLDEQIPETTFAVIVIHGIGFPGKLVLMG